MTVYQASGSARQSVVTWAIPKANRKTTFYAVSTARSIFLDTCDGCMIPYRSLSPTSVLASNGKMRPSPTIPDPSQFVNTHLASSRNSVSCETLDLLSKGAEQFRRTLKIVKRDLDLQLNGRKLIFALDFSELHGYLWPSQSKARGANTVKLLLDSPSLTFTMLPGTVVELARHLRYFSRLGETTLRDFDDFASRPMVAAFLRQIHSAPPGKTAEVNDEYVSLIEGYLQGLGDLEGLVSRLEQFNEKRNIIPLSALLQDTNDPIRVDEEVFHGCRLSLELRRPGESLNNVIDAHNYALCWSLSHAHTKMENNTVFCLVTSSPNPTHVFRQHRWDCGSMPEMTLVRHPIQVLYLAHLQTDPIAASRKLDEMMSQLEMLTTTWERQPALKRYRAGKESASMVVKLPTDHTYLECFAGFMSSYNTLFSGIRDAIEADLIVSDNYRRMRDISTFSTESRVVGLSSTEDRPSTRITFRLFDYFTKMVVQTMSRLKSNIVNIEDLVREIDVEGIIVDPVRLKPSIIHHAEDSSTTIVFQDINSDKVYCSADIYSDYFAMVWETGSTFAEFLPIARTWYAETLSKPDIEPASQSKAFLGVYLYLEDSDQPIIELPFGHFQNLSSDELFEVTGRRAVQMVRVATDVGDVAYEFHGGQSSTPRVSLISHVVNEDSASWFVYRTNRRRVGFNQVQHVVAQIVKHMPSRETTVKGEN